MRTIQTLAGAWVLCMMLAMHAHADSRPYGRLFLTPEQRAALDDARQHKPPPAPKPVAKKIVAAPRTTKVEPPPKPSGNVVLNGIVRRSDGESTIWVNGVAMPGDAQTGKVQVAPISGQTGVVQIPDANSSARVELKVGQKLDMSSGTVTESYANRVPQKNSIGTRTLPMPERRPRKVRPQEAETDTQ